MSFPTIGRPCPKNYSAFILYFYRVYVTDQSQVVTIHGVWVTDHNQAIIIHGHVQGHVGTIYKSCIVTHSILCQVIIFYYTMSDQYGQLSRFSYSLGMRATMRQLLFIKHAYIFRTYYSFIKAISFTTMEHGRILASVSWSLDLIDFLVLTSASSF